MKPLLKIQGLLLPEGLCDILNAMKQFAPAMHTPKTDKYLCISTFQPAD